MTRTIEYTAELVVITCWCGMDHAVPAALRDFQLRQHRDGERVTSIYCPLGHQHAPAGEGEAVKLRKRLESTQASLTHTRDQLQAERSSHAATKGQLTKSRKRAAAGVCPCCNRSFVDVRRHMRSKHPDELPEMERALP